MGDNLDEGFFERENEKLSENVSVELVETDEDDDASSSDNELIIEEIKDKPKKTEDATIEAKTLKRKKKFKELKLIKKMKHDQEVLSSDSTHELSVISTAAMLKDLSELQSSGAEPKKLLLEERHFYSTSGSSLTKQPRPKSDKVYQNSFVKAIASGIPSFWKCLHPKNYVNEEKGCPKVIVICSGARRAANVINAMSKELKCKIAKLFAKHFKVEEQVSFLGEHFCHVAVGTPNRLSKLIELGALSLSKTRVLLIDMATDEKNFNILTMPIVKDDFFTFMKTSVEGELSHIKITLLNSNEKC
jgi:protein CMS1